MRRVSLPWMLAYSAARIGVGVHDMFFNAVAGFYLASYGLPNVAIGFLPNQRSFLGSLLQPVAGAVSDRIRTPIGRRKPFLLLIALVVPGFLLLMGRSETWFMVIIFILGPVFLSLAVVAYEVLLPDCVVPDQRGTANGVARALGFAGAIGLVLFAFLFWQTHPWAVFLLVAAALALGFLVTGLLVREPPALADSLRPEATGSVGRGLVPRRPHGRPPGDSELRTQNSEHDSRPTTQDSGPFSYVRGLLQYRAASRYVASYFLYWAGIGGVTPFITRFGHEELGIPQNETFLLMVAVLVTTFIAAAPAGWLGDRLGKKPVMSWGVLAFGLLILAGSQVQTKEQALVVLALAGLAQAVPTVLAYPLFTELVPGRRMGELSGLSSMVWSLAQPLGATAFGALADVTGTLRSVLLGGGLALLASWLVLQTVRTAPIASVGPPQRAGRDV